MPRLAVERLPATAPDAPLARLLLGVAELAAGDATAPTAPSPTPWKPPAPRPTPGGRRAPRSCSGPASPMRAAIAISRKASPAALVRSCATPTWRGQGVAALVHAMAARLAVHHGATAQARADLASAERLRGDLAHALPWAALRARLDMAAALLALTDVAGARLQLREIREIEWLRPDLGALDAEVATVAAQVDAIRETNLSAFMLTVAELRLLPLLATHLTFPEIGERLFLSTNTIKTEAKSIYRKLNVASAQRRGRAGAARSACSSRGSASRR